SAGFLLTIAADVAAMAPGTHIGAAHPVAGGGEKVDETMAKRAAEDVDAYARTLASRRHRNVKLAEEAVNTSRALTDEEALHASPPLVDLVASDVPDLLKLLNGRTITRFDGRTVVLKTAGARVIPTEMTLRQRVLGAIAHPNVAYLLLSLGTLALTIELWTGGVLAGVAGGLCLRLARAAAAQRLAPVAGVAGRIGEVGEALTSIEPGRKGRVMTHGEIWTAIAPEPIAEGDRIRITSVDGLTLTVHKA